MRIIRDNKIYIQKNDIAYLNMSDEQIPAIIYYKLFESGTMIVGDFNRYDFVEYSDKNIIDFFRNIPWILDYDEVKDLSDEEIDALGEELIDQRNSIATMYNSMSIEERSKNQSLKTQCDLLEFKILTIREFQMFKDGKSEMKLPSGIETPSRSKKGIKTFIKSLYDRFRK